MSSITKNPFCFLFLFLLSGGQAYSQNLIADPGIEIWDGTTGTSPHTLGSLQHWYEANGTPDYHNTDIMSGSNLTGLQPCPTGEGNTWCGYPHEGKGVLGCWKGNGPDGTREWAGTRLLSPMVPGDCYEISFWIQNKKDNPAALYETNQWGMFFSKTQYPSFNPSLANFTPMADRWVACSQVISGSEWQKVTFTYTPSQAFEYAFIGFMGNVANSTFTAANDDYLLGFYVWIDEVVIQHVDVRVPEAATICPGDSVLLSFESDYPITWTDGVRTDTSASVWVKPETTTTYYVEAQGELGCTKRDSVTITVRDRNYTDYPELVCTATAPFLLDPDAPQGYWSGEGIVDAVTGLFDPTVTGSGAFSVDFISAGDCRENFTMFVEVAETPGVHIVADVDRGCPPLTVQFSDEAANPGATYAWSFGDGAAADNPKTVGHTFADGGVYDLDVAVTHFPRCTTELTIPEAVQVYEPPTAGFEYTPERPDLLENNVRFENTSEGSIVQYRWDFGDLTGSSLGDPAHEYLTPGDFQVTLQVTDVHQCTDSITRSLTVRNKVKLYLPNAFSPNDDGINDKFEIGYAGLLYDYRMTVFNRWGGLVFQSTDPAEGWNGKSLNGQPAGTGVYSYVIEYTLAPETPSGGKAVSDVVSGDVMIMR
ncbi:MAG: gliding motility-associated C-terminal domain-containing protein [Lewinellaceae bacterium]|nr:gliding motility-associated C-terminal domain-containing protein [Lewinellaceae bacterium]